MKKEKLLHSYDTKELGKEEPPLQNNFLQLLGESIINNKNNRMDTSSKSKFI